MMDLLKRLSLEFGPSGLEFKVRELIEKELSPYASGFEAYTDRLGSYIIHIPKENAPRLLICAHMDEVGFMVTEICDNGRLRYGTVGGIDPLVCASKRVVSENGAMGAIISKPIHLQSSEERGKVTGHDSMYIDIGCDTKEEAESLVQLGDLFTFVSDFCEFGNGFIKGKALDDRLGCAIMCKAIENIITNGLALEYDTYFAFSTREEVGLSGAYAVAERIKPDYAFIIESTAVGDIFGAPDEKLVAKLGKGGALSFADLATIYDKELINHIIGLCRERGIDYQIKQYVSGGNDAGNIQRSAYGTRVAVMSAPSRYIHSASNVIHKNDLESIYNTLMALISSKQTANG